MLCCRSWGLAVLGAVGTSGWEESWPSGSPTQWRSGLDAEQPEAGSWIYISLFRLSRALVGVGRVLEASDGGASEEDRCVVLRASG